MGLGQVLLDRIVYCKDYTHWYYLARILQRNHRLNEDRIRLSFLPPVILKAWRPQAICENGSVPNIAEVSLCAADAKGTWSKVRWTALRNCLLLPAVFKTAYLEANFYITDFLKWARWCSFLLPLHISFSKHWIKSVIFFVMTGDHSIW